MTQAQPQAGRCRVCGRPLPVSRDGIGPVCARRLTGPTRRRKAVRRPKPATVPPAPDAIPGQTELDLFHHQATLWSL